MPQNMFTIRYFTFKAYLDKNQAEGKHYNAIISYAVKKLVRVIFHLEKFKKEYKS